jgi:hypothetical protein
MHDNISSNFLPVPSGQLPSREEKEREGEDGCPL